MTQRYHQAWMWSRWPWRGLERLPDELTGSRWQVDLAGLSRETLQAAREAFLAEDEIFVQRMTKNGMREFDSSSGRAQA